MVCIYCGAKTHVTNSRMQRRSRQVWRRRQCFGCRAVFTTEEVVQYALTWMVVDRDGKFHPFSRDKLFLSIYQCLQHRPNPQQDATELTGTVINRLKPMDVGAALSPREIVSITQVVLNRFDKVASVQYAALHKRNY